MSRRRWATVLVTTATVVGALTLVNFSGVASAAVSNVLIKGTGSGRCLTPLVAGGGVTSTACHPRASLDRLDRHQR